MQVESLLARGQRSRWCHFRPPNHDTQTFATWWLSIYRQPASTFTKCDAVEPPFEKPRREHVSRSHCIRQYPLPLDDIFSCSVYYMCRFQKQKKCFYLENLSPAHTASFEALRVSLLHLHSLSKPPPCCGLTNNVVGTACRLPRLPTSAAGFSSGSTVVLPSSRRAVASAPPPLPYDSALWLDHAACVNTRLTRS